MPDRTDKMECKWDDSDEHSQNIAVAATSITKNGQAIAIREKLTRTHLLFFDVVIKSKMPPKNRVDMFRSLVKRIGQALVKEIYTDKTVLEVAMYGCQGADFFVGQVCMLGIVVDNQRQADMRRFVVQDVASDKKLVEELLEHSAVNDVGVVFKMPDPEGGASVPGTRILLGDGSMSESCLTQVGHATINPESVGRAEQIDSTLLLQLSLKRKDQRAAEATVTPHAALAIAQKGKKTGGGGSPTKGSTSSGGTKAKGKDKGKDHEG